MWYNCVHLLYGTIFLVLQQITPSSQNMSARIHAQVVGFRKAVVMLRDQMVRVTRFSCDVSTRLQGIRQGIKTRDIWIWWTFSHESAEVQFVMFYWLDKVRRSYSLKTESLLNFCTGKTERHLQTWAYCHLLGLDETSIDAYNSGETQTFNLYFCYFSVGKDSGEVFANGWQEGGNFEVLKRCSIQIYPTRFLSVLWKSF